MRAGYGRRTDDKFATRRRVATFVTLGRVHLHFLVSIAITRRMAQTQTHTHKLNWRDV